MSLTVLKVVQDILSSMDSDEVNSIGDTVESTDVARCVAETFNGIITDYDIESIVTGYQLQGLGDVTKPTHMTVPETTQSIIEIRYDVRKQATDTQVMRPIQYLDPSPFVDIVAQRDATQANILEVTLSDGLKIGVQTDHAPNYWTTFDQETVIFDSYNNNIDTTMHSSRSWALGREGQDLIVNDFTLINLPRELEDLLMTNARELCFDLYKGSTPKKVVERARKSRVRMKILKDRLRRASPTGPDYGRNSGKPSKFNLGYTDSGSARPLPDWWT
jgi:hypothetical protein